VSATKPFFFLNPFRDNCFQGFKVPVSVPRAIKWNIFRSKASNDRIIKKKCSPQENDENHIFSQVLCIYPLKKIVLTVTT